MMTGRRAFLDILQIEDGVGCNLQFGGQAREDVGACEIVLVNTLHI